MEKYLVLWEFARKQDYIFKSNKLKECVGASLIIKSLSENFEELNIKLNEENFIVKGGGKTIYSFENRDERSKFIEELSVKILKSYPGLEVFITTEEYDENESIVKNVIDSLYKKLESKKTMRKNAALQLGFGIEVPCTSTGLPASGKENLNNEIIVKRAWAERKQEKEFAEIIPTGYELVKEIDDLLSSKSKNYVAVVHIDGNAMGKKIKKLSDSIVQKEDETVKEFNIRYINAIRKFSLDIARAYENSFKTMTERIESKKEELEDITRINKNKFPVRPLILAGDDVTYVTNGAIGVESARVFIEELKKYEIIIEDQNLGRLNACAGIAIIKSGYPFIKAYGLCEELCKNAKKAILDDKSIDDASALDFHISQGDINCSLHTLRQREYSFNGEDINLTMKPFFVGEDNQWRNYSNFITSLERIQYAIEEEKVGRNKIKSLRNEFKKGPKSTEMFIKFYKIENNRYLPPLPNTEGDYCFNNKEGENICMYLDAIEVMDNFRKI